MKKKIFTNGLVEWNWTQKFSCGHREQVVVLRDKRPVEIRKEMGKEKCPKCQLEKLLEER